LEEVVVIAGDHVPGKRRSLSTDQPRITYGTSASVAGSISSRLVSKAAGARWKHTTGDEVLQLRVLQLSDRWTAAVQRHQAARQARADRARARRHARAAGVRSRT